MKTILKLTLNTNSTHDTLEFAQWLRQYIFRSRTCFHFLSLQCPDIVFPVPHSSCFQIITIVDQDLQCDTDWWFNQRRRQHLFPSGNGSPSYNTSYWPQHWMPHLKMLTMLYLRKTHRCVWPCQIQHCAHQRMQSWSCGQGLCGIDLCFA